MQFTEKCEATIDACRFCWMCRHICPIGNATGQERNTSRARALSLSMVKRGALEADADIVDNLYECALCGGCTADCATGWDPVLFTKQARRGAALDGRMPAYADRLLKNHEGSGNIYGCTGIDGKLEAVISSLPRKANILFFIGADGRYKTPDKAAEAIELLRLSGVPFTADADESGSGYELDFLIGALDETKKQMEMTARKINSAGVTTVVCYDPQDAKTFTQTYREYGIALKPQVLTFTAYLAELIGAGALVPTKSELVFTPQDPVSLARDLEDTQSIRKVLGFCGGLREMLLHGKETVLAGNLIMNEYIPSVMSKVAVRRLEMAENVGAEWLVTASPSDYAMLDSVNNGKINIITVEEAVRKCL